MHVLLQIVTSHWGKNVLGAIYDLACPVLETSAAGESPVGSFWTVSELGGAPITSDTPRLVCPVERLKSA